MDFRQTIEEHLGIKAKNEFLPMQPGDVKERYADIGELRDKSSTTIDQGVKQVVEWYVASYHKN